MRVLEFNVKDQTLSKSPNCDFDGIVPGSIGYVSLHFVFNDEWKDLDKVCEFITTEQSSYYKLKSDDCNIPQWLSDASYFRIKLYGVKSGFKIETNTVLIRQNGSQ